MSDARGVGGWGQLLASAASVVVILSQYDAAIAKLGELLPIPEAYLPVVVWVVIGILVSWFGIAIWRRVTKRPRRRKKVERQPPAAAAPQQRKPARAVESPGERMRRKRMLDDARWLYDWYESGFGDRVSEHRAELVYSELVEEGLLSRMETLNLTPFGRLDPLAKVIAVLERNRVDDAIAMLRGMSPE